MKIFTVRFFSIGQGVGHIDFHVTANVDWPRTRTCMFSRYGSCVNWPWNR
jgi:hypothetical protein